MTVLRYVVFVGLAFLWPCWVCADSSPASQPVLTLNGNNNGQPFVATVGELMQFTLYEVGPWGYGDPQISSAAVRLKSIEPKGIPTPAGPVLLYTFEAVAEGEAHIFISHNVPNGPKGNGITLTIRVRKA